MIRWAPSALRMVAYYANLMLLSSFLGLGIGALLASSKRRLFGLFPALAVPLPVFFAGLIFSLTFRGAAKPAALFGANLIGAMAGGFCEYLGMATGHRGLSLLVIAAYLASLLCRLRMNAAGACA